MSPATAASSPNLDAAVQLIEANSQQRADALGGDTTAVQDISTMSAQDASTGASFSQREAKEELRLRRTLASGDPLVVGAERLDVGTGSISVELLDKKKIGTDTYDLTLN